MVEQQLEIEIKSLLGNEENTNALLEVMQKNDPNFSHIVSNSQLNHYFEGVVEPKTLLEALLPHVSQTDVPALERILADGKDLSVRSRQKNSEVIVVIKASIDDTTSANGTARLEFESTMTDISLDELDEVLLNAGLAYQAKWSRVRKEYAYKDMQVCIDRNAGYGYVAEFEKVITDITLSETEKEKIRNEMAVLGIEELPQERLERMFAYYNKNWKDYYGTDKTFTIE